MIEVFTTNFINKIQEENTLNLLKMEFSKLIFTFDLEDIYNSYPCGKSILRFEGLKISPDDIIMILNKFGFECLILENKICKN